MNGDFPKPCLSWRGKLGGSKFTSDTPVSLSLDEEKIHITSSTEKKPWPRNLSKGNAPSQYALPLHIP